MEKLVCVEQVDPRDLRDQEVHLDQEAHVVKLEALVELDLLDPEDHEDQLVNVAQLAR